MLVLELLADWLLNNVIMLAASSFPGVYHSRSDTELHRFPAQDVWPSKLFVSLEPPDGLHTIPGGEPILHLLLRGLSQSDPYTAQPRSKFPIFLPLLHLRLRP